MDSRQLDLTQPLSIYESYKRSPYLSVKHSSYFQVYSELLEKYRGTEVVFVEIGVLNGGSLFMWRDYFGPKARIIGVDFNPGAKQWEKDGFEIFIGDQGDKNFWQSFFQSIGPVDVVLDDGGHSYAQQIVTTHCCIPYIHDGGLMIVEDTHTSYFEEHGYPTKYSFIEWTKVLIDNINSRFPRVKVSNLPYKDSIYSITTYESIVCFKIDRSKCFESAPTSNGGISSDAENYVFRGTSVATNRDKVRGFGNRFKFVRESKTLKRAYKALFTQYAGYVSRKQMKRLRDHFS